MPRSAGRAVGEGNALDDDSKSMRGAAQRGRSVWLAPGRPVAGPKPLDGCMDRLGGERIGGPALHVTVRPARTGGRGCGEPAGDE